MTDTTAPIQPLVDPDSAGFWSGLAEGELRITRCQACQRWQHPPLERCRLCHGLLGFEPVAGVGHLYSYIVAHYPAFPANVGDIPYVIGLVELDEQPGLRLPARLLADSRDVAIGMRVAVSIVELAGGPLHLPVFKPDPDGP